MTGPRRVEALPAPRGAAIRVLVVDDNPAIHEDFRRIFESETSEDDPEFADVTAALFGEASGSTRKERPQVELGHAAGGVEAIALAHDQLNRGRPFEFAFVDVRMPPGIDGVETAERLWEVDPALRIVICTAFSDYSYEVIRERLQHRDQLSIVRKPFDPGYVRQMLLLHAA